MTKGKHMKVIRGEEKVNWKSKGVGGEINLCVPYDFICIVAWLKGSQLSLVGGVS